MASMASCGLARACTVRGPREGCRTRRVASRKRCCVVAERVGRPTDVYSAACVSAEGGDGCGAKDLVGGGREESQSQIRTHRDRRSDGMDACVVGRHGTLGVSSIYHRSATEICLVYTLPPAWPTLSELSFLVKHIRAASARACCPAVLCAPSCFVARSLVLQGPHARRTCNTYRINDNTEPATPAGA